MLIPGLTRARLVDDYAADAPERRRQITLPRATKLNRLTFADGAPLFGIGCRHAAIRL